MLWSFHSDPEGPPRDEGDDAKHSPAGGLGISGEADHGGDKQWEELCLAKLGAESTAQHLQDPYVPEVATQAKAAGEQVEEEAAEGAGDDVGHAEWGGVDAGGFEVEVEVVAVVMVDDVVGGELDTHAVLVDDIVMDFWFF